MSGALTLRFTTQAQLDIRRITQQLGELQRQVASGAKANDLRGFGGASSRLLNAQSLRASADARASVLNQMEARFGVQGAALGQVAEASGLLATSIREAISANDGRGIVTELSLSFSSVVAALNETWNGQPLFAGERQGGAGPIKIDSLEDLLAAGGPEDIFDEAARHQILDLGAGTPIIVSAKASELSEGLFDVLLDLKTLVDASGGTIGQPISGGDRAALQAIAERLDKEADNFTNEEGRAGQLETRFGSERSRLQERSNLLLKEIGSEADVDLAEVSVQLSSLLVQYEAAAKTFADLSQLSLLQYLR
ncbi:MAG: flagellin [Hyphomonadaceae bacterium]